MAFLRFFLRNTSPAVSLVAVIMEAVGFILLFGRDLFIGASVMAAVILGFSVSAIYSNDEAIKQREKILDEREGGGRKIIGVDASHQRPTEPTNKVVPLVILFIVMFAAVGAARVYEVSKPAPFSVRITYSYWSKKDIDRSADFFAVSPAKMVTLPVNLSIYVRIFNGPAATWIDKIGADALVNGQWIALAPMPDEDSGAEYFLSGTDTFGEGWALPKSMDFGVVTEQQLRPSGRAEGWTFFAYPETFPQEVSRFRLSITNNANQAVVTYIDAKAFQPPIHGPVFPPRSKLQDFHTWHSVFYANQL